MIPPELPELIGGKYRPLAVIGEGAMGIVYSVEHTLTGEQLALKVMTAHHGATREAIERFKREARAAAKIKSEHVVRIIDADVAPELDRAPYLVMDLLDGVDLEKASGDNPLPAQTVVEWLRQIARVLDKAHRIGITHRDLKPENLFLTHREDGRPLIKILDFGIAKFAAESTGTTQSGQILGTPLYMSPEQARGDADLIGPSADLYALGLIAYKLLAGYPYWDATSVAGIIGQVLYEPMTPPSVRGCNWGPLFDAWFFRACNRDAALRFGSPVEQIEALAKALGLPFDSQPHLLLGVGDSGNANASAPDTVVSGQPRFASSAGESGGDRPAPTLAESGGTLVSSSTEMPDVRLMGVQKRRRVGFYAVVSAAVLVSTLVVVFYQGEPAAPVPLEASKPAAATPTLAGAAVLVEVPGPPIPAVPSQSPPVEPLQAPKTTPVVLGTPSSMAKRRDPPRPAQSRGTASAAPVHSDKTLVNDPLSDQK